MLLSARERVRGQNLQAHGGAARSPDQLHNVVELPADDVDQLAVLTLANRRDAVVRADPAIDRRGTAGYHVQD